MFRFQDFCSLPEFTGVVGDFLAASADKFSSDLSMDAEQPLEYYGIFEEYQRLIEGAVEAFLQREGTTAEALFEVVRGCQTRWECGAVTCVDYLVASTEYPHFLGLVADFKALEQWGGDAETETDQPLGGLPNGSPGDDDNDDDDDGPAVAPADAKPTAEPKAEPKGGAEAGAGVKCEFGAKDSLASAAGDHGDYGAKGIEAGHTEAKEARPEGIGSKG